MIVVVCSVTCIRLELTALGGMLSARVWETGVLSLCDVRYRCRVVSARQSSQSLELTGEARRHRCNRPSYITLGCHAPYYSYTPRPDCLSKLPQLCAVQCTDFAFYGTQYSTEVRPSSQFTTVVFEPFRSRPSRLFAAL